MGRAKKMFRIGKDPIIQPSTQILSEILKFKVPAIIPWKFREILIFRLRGDCFSQNSSAQWSLKVVRKQTEPNI